MLLSEETNTSNPIESLLNKEITKREPEKNEFLDKAQKRFEAVEWEQQMYFHFHCAKKAFIEIEGVKYNGRTISDPEEIDIADKQIIWERLLLSYQYSVSKMLLEDLKDPKKMDEFKDKIKEIKKPVDDADRELFLICCLYFYGIDKDTALKNKEMLMPYLIGRRYLQGKAFVGRAFQDMKENKSTERNSSLSTIVDGLTKDHY